ncbi:CSLREA domain-containing protein [Pseudomonas borbori]
MSARYPWTLLLAAALAAPLTANALDLRVTTLADEDDGNCSTEHCSLREAVSAGNAAGQAKLYLKAGDYRLSRQNALGPDGRIIDEDANLTGDLDIRGELTIVGKGRFRTILFGEALDRVLDVQPEGHLQLRALTITGGSTPFRGAGMKNQGSTKLVDVLISGNFTATSAVDGQGGGIYNTGSMLILRSTVGANQTTGSESGTGRGGGIYNTGELYIRESQITTNRCSDPKNSGEGCGIFSTGQADIARSYFWRNESSTGSGAAILNHGQLLLSNSTLSDNKGTGSNSAALQNGSAGADNRDVTLKLVHTTIAGNKARGLANEARVNLRNSVIAGNTLAGQPSNCTNSGSVIGYQAYGLLIGLAAGDGCAASHYIPDSSTFINHLYPLSSAGEGTASTRVHRLRPSSFAIDSGWGACSSHDQLSVSRPRDGDGDGVAICDLGAYEY